MRSRVHPRVRRVLVGLTVAGVLIAPASVKAGWPMMLAVDPTNSIAAGINRLLSQFPSENSKDSCFAGASGTIEDVHCEIALRCAVAMVGYRSDTVRQLVIMFRPDLGRPQHQCTSRDLQLAQVKAILETFQGIQAERVGQIVDVLDSDRSGWDACPSGIRYRFPEGAGCLVYTRERQGGGWAAKTFLWYVK